MSHTRREFIKKTGAGVVGASVLGSFHAPYIKSADKTEVRGKRRPTLVVIYLRGGADPLNTIVPYRDKNYYAVRPTIAIASPEDPKLTREQTPAIPITSTFGLHPSLSSLARMFKQGMMAPIINVGSTHTTRSHFDAQDFMERAAPGVRSITEGWLNRYLSATAGPDDHFLRAFSPQALLPRSLRGRYSALAAPGPGSETALETFRDFYKRSDDDLARVKKLREEAERLEKLSPTKRRAAERERLKAEKKFGKPPVTDKDLSPMINRAGVNTVEKMSHLNKILGSGDRDDRRGGNPRLRLHQQLSDIAKIISAGAPLEISAVDYNGWDHHSYQGGAEGKMATMLKYVDDSINDFVKQIGPVGMQNVVLLTMSEFGRTVRENGSGGSDHGHGGFMLAVGGPVNGGKVYGKWTGLAPGALYQKRDLPVYTDFRDVFAEALLGLYQFDTRETEFFPGHKNPMRRPLKLFKEA